MRRSMSLAHYQIEALWQRFMPLRNAIANKVSTDLISLANYNTDYFDDFNPLTEFERWATVEVSGFANLPEEMETFVIPGGLYAVFLSKGLSTDHTIFHYIYGTWLPSSEYALDHRPHFEILGEKYRKNDPLSEEEIWIPIKAKHEKKA